MAFVSSFALKAVVQKCLCEVLDIWDFAAHHPLRKLKIAAAEESARYAAENMGDASGLRSGKDVLALGLQRISIEGHALEFGVFRGGSIRYIAKILKGSTVDGFDSFVGLPESWGVFGHGQGAFSLAGKMPRVPNNVVLHAGWFTDTIPRWMAENSGPIAFLHVDCDLYSSTKTIFDLLGGRMQVGTIIVFDEYFGFPNWRQHEFKAFSEFVRERGVKYHYLAFAKWQVAVRITEINA